ncbi:hydrolase [Vibrio metschnikovii]|uniref:hydrolase n=1 Tax=Vibrio metschnikovii TaxID=28172 RepID=UPI001302D52E|nr:hydrolase [Vibrio metschnikovii]EKO3691981.1 hydrolase [Vibrio metschnikovii]EKO3780935.1 hydrolase [Vibrio metschnikovii]EKO3887831.1 hydrolase [Vibrio metschnikovii]EKO3891096.1 hydrolase [Vibrio metschnikovii]EKO3936122.1 hydrolase [Vibrio metschnikovii]
MLDKENTGLIIVDIQGKLARLVSDSNELVSNCIKLIKGAQLLGLPIVLLEQNPAKLGQTIEELSVLLSNQQPISKFSFDACGEPRFVEVIQKSNKTSWLICGIEAHICVYQTAIHLKNLGYNIHLVGDCVSSRNESNKELAIKKLAGAGVDITGLEMCLYELVKDCRAPEFKEILNLIK